MTNYRNKYFIMVLFGALIFTAACKKQWSQRDAVTDQNLNVNLYQQIQANSNLSIFAGYIAKIGFDKVLAASKTYTVWAPTNAALAGIDPAIVADTAQLHLFVADHIANQVFLTSNIGTSVRLRTLNGKNVIFTPTTVEDANITTHDQYVSNGVLNIIDKPLYVKLNIDQFVRGLTTVGQLHKAYIGRQDSSFTDTSKATVASINPVNGKPVLVPGTGLVKINKYYNRIAKLDNEDSLYTYFVLTDVAYTNEINKVSKYFVTSALVDTTQNILSAFNVLKDVAVRGKILPANLPASLTSVNGVPVPIDKTAIVQTYNASNGIVYVMSAMNFDVSTKITPIVIEGERASFYKQAANGSTVIANNLRYRLDNNGVPYRDLFTASGINAYFAAYKLSNLYTCQYKVVIRAINDTAFTRIAISPQNPAAPTGYTVTAPNGTPYANYNISERIEFGQLSGAVATNGVYAITTAVNYPYQNIPAAPAPAVAAPFFYAEMQYTNPVAGTVAPNATISIVNNNLNVSKYNSIYMYLIGQTVTTANFDDILVDYIKLIPILQ